MFKIFNILKKNPSEKCFKHPDKDALSFCHGCKKHYCADCLIEGPSFYYCKSEDCLRLYSSEKSYSLNPRFCPQCLSETTDESSGDIISVNLIGDKFVNESREECPICGSIVLEKIGPIAGRKGSYRVIYLDSNRTKFISRKRIQKY